MAKGRVLFVVAPSNFRDEELFEPKAVLEAAGMSAKIASTNAGTAKGRLGGTAEATMAVRDANAGDFDAVVFVGGNGVEEHLLYEKEEVLKLARDALRDCKALCAICIAPRILAKAGLLGGIKATAFADEDTLKMLQQAGAKYTGKAVEQDGRIITANGPQAARAFGEKIRNAMGG